MIKNLIQIQGLSVLEQNFKDNYSSLNEISFEKDELGSGAFGTVHSVKSINGAEVSDYVIKLINEDRNPEHSYETIKQLHLKLKKHQLKTGIPTYHEFPQFLGLPFATFKAYDEIEEKDRIALLMFDLTKLGFADFGDDFIDIDEVNSIELTDKFYIAYQLASAFDFLHKNDFINSDFEKNSIWLNSKTLQLALIDFDSGFNLNIQDKPTTIGKLGHWIGSTLRNIISDKKDSSELTTLDRINEEYWIMANAIFEIVFGGMPYFFLSDSDDTTKTNYIKTFEWPNIDYDSPYMNPSNIEAHKKTKQLIEQLEEFGFEWLIQMFKQTFNKGYKNEKHRHTIRDWKNALEKVNKEMPNAPLSSFLSNKSSISSRNEEVTFSFIASRFNRILVNEMLVPIGFTNIKLPIYDEGEVTLRVENDISSFEKTIQISANKIEPKFIELEVPKQIRDDDSPILIKWNVENAKSVIFASSDEELPINFFMNVKPTEKTTYKLKAIGHFDQIVEKEVIIDVIKPQINFFDWEVNLNEGLDNVDLSWETENVQKVTITPNIGEVKLNGKKHVGIDCKTEFTLLAKGIFGTVVEHTIKAQPFPVPIVKQIFTEAPEISISANIEFNENIIPQGLINLGNVNFTNQIQFNNKKVNTDEVNLSLKIPDFETDNLLEKNFLKEKFTLTDIYNSLLKKVYKKLNK
jgi:serine/threonine protein kinase